MAESVLDLKGEKNIKIRAGREEFVKKLQQLMSPVLPCSVHEASNLKPALPADRPLAFVQRAREKINGALLRCEERYPNSAPHSVLVVTVDRDAAGCREKLSAIHSELFGPGQSDPMAPTQLEVIDRVTDEAIQRLIEAGLLNRNTRASRPLFPIESGASPLSPEERMKAEGHRANAARKLKMARLLQDGDLAEEGRSALLEAILAAARAFAAENRLAEPSALEDSLLPPVAHCWREALEGLRSFAADRSASWQPVFDWVQSLLAR